MVLRSHLRDGSAPSVIKQKTSGLICLMELYYVAVNFLMGQVVTITPSNITKLLVFILSTPS